MHTVTDGLMLNTGSYVKLHRIDHPDTILIAHSQADGSLVNAATGDAITEHTLKNWRVGESFSVVNSLRPFSGNKLKTSEFHCPQLLSFKKEMDGDYVGRMSLIITTPDGIDLPCAFNIFVDVGAGDHWQVSADCDSEISLGEGFIVGEELCAVAADELNQVFCLDQTLRQFDKFSESIKEKIDWLSAQIY